MIANRGARVPKFSRNAPRNRLNRLPARTVAAPTVGVPAMIMGFGVAVFGEADRLMGIAPRLRPGRERDDTLAIGHCARRIGA